MSSLELEIVKGTFTLLAVALGSAIGFFVFFRQKEYELTKQRYLEQGIDIAAAALQAALGTVSHNFARSLQLCRQYRDMGDRFNAEELERGFLELNSSNFHQTAHYRVGSLLQDQVVWEVFQSAMAYASSANTLITQEIPDAIRVLAAAGEGTRDRHSDAGDMVRELQTAHDASFKYAVFGRELHALAVLLEETRLSRKAVSMFHKRQDVRAVIERLRKEYPQD